MFSHLAGAYTFVKLAIKMCERYYSMPVRVKQTACFRFTIWISRYLQTWKYFNCKAASAQKTYSYMAWENVKNCRHSTALRRECCLEKKSKKLLYCPDKNYYYFCRLNISLINSVIGSRNMIKVLKIRWK